MTGPAQFIRLSAEDDGRSTMANLRLAPDAEWPPPEVIYTVTPHGMGWAEAVMSLDADIVDEIAGFMDEPENRDLGLGYTMTPWKRVSCSKLDADTVTGSYVARGADYVPIGEEDEA